MIALLAAGLLERDLKALRAIGRDAGWELHEAATCREMIAALLSRQVHVVISERELPVGDWTGLLQILSALPSPPRLIVTSRWSDRQFFAEALSRGAFDVLATPFQSGQVAGIVKLAYFLWLRERQWTEPPVLAPAVPCPTA